MVEPDTYEGKLGQLRRVCRRCDFCGTGCLGCFIGNGGDMEDGDMWNEGCSTICRDEDFEVGRLEPLGLYSHVYHKNGWMCDGREIDCPCKGCHK